MEPPPPEGLEGRVEDGDGSVVHVTKKLKTGGSGCCDSSLGRTAEIVLFLSGMSQMRGARVPTAIERGLMEEATHRLSHLAGLLAPGDFVPHNSVADMAEDLGFNRNADITENSRATLEDNFAERQAEFEATIANAHKLASKTEAIASHIIPEQDTALALPGVSRPVSVEPTASVAHAGALVGQATRSVQPYQIKAPSPVAKSPLGYPLALVDQRMRSGQSYMVTSPIPEGLLQPVTCPVTLEAQRTMVAHRDQVTGFPMVPKFSTAHLMAPLSHETRMAHLSGVTRPVRLVPFAPTTKSIALQAQTTMIARPDQVTLSVPVAHTSQVTSPVTSIAKTATVARSDHVTPPISMVLSDHVDHPTSLPENKTKIVKSERTSSVIIALAAPVAHQGTATAQATIEPQPDQSKVTVPIHLPGTMSGQTFLSTGQSRVSMADPSRVSSSHQTSLSSVMLGSNGGMPGSSVVRVPVIPVSSSSVQPQGPSEAEGFGSTNSHIAIARVVKQVLQSLSSNRTESYLPSISYVNAQISCQICRDTVNDVASVLICDWCENAFHVKCHQPYPVKDIPKSEWYCSKCLSATNGKPYPIKYGRVGKHAAV